MIKEPSNSAAELLGLSTDIKPLNYEIGSTFYELDTKIFYIFDGTNWYPL